MISFEKKHCEANDNLIDPELCLQYQIKKLMRAEEHIDDVLDPDFGTEEYQLKSALWKKNKIWQKILEDDTPMPFITGEDIEQMFFDDMNESFDHFHDVMPEGRDKLLHPEGVTMKVAWIPEPNIQYTGMFREAQHGFMRISDALVGLNQFDISSPSLGLKFLRDGMYAADAVAMVHVDGQSSYNFFKNRYLTNIAPGEFECAV